MSISRKPLTGQFTGVGASSGTEVLGKCNITLTFSGTATVALQRSYDSGTTWHTLSKDAGITAAEFVTNVDVTIEEPEKNVFYRWECISHTSGTVDYRIGVSNLGHF